VGNARGAVGRAKRLRNAMKPSEHRLWRELRKLDAHIRRQAPIGSYVADFACHAKKLVIEVDGEIHERLAEVALRDLTRTAWLERQAYRVARFTNRQVDADVFAVVEEIKKLLALPLDGEGLGWGVSAGVTSERDEAPAPNGAVRPGALPTPQSPALSPSRGKGGDLPRSKRQDP
jgi:very-short-patch-repair endonuclease